MTRAFECAMCVTHCYLKNEDDDIEDLPHACPWGKGYVPKWTEDA